MFIRKTTAILSTAVLGLSLMAATPSFTGLANDEKRAPAVGEQDLFNFEHVYNFNLANTDAALPSRKVDNQGTDVEFFTVTTVVRNQDGERIGADGEVLAAGDADYVAERDFAIVGDHSDGIGIFDITNPEETYLAAYQVCGNPRADVGVYQFTDANTGELRTIIGSSRESGPTCVEAGPQTTEKAIGNNPLESDTGGVSMFEVTDPYNPAPFAQVQVGAGGAHNFKFHPTAPVAYAWNGELGTGVSSIQIIDLRPVVEQGLAPENITSYVGPSTLGSVHDGELSPDGSVMYAASENNYEIFDNTDPFNPTLTTAFAPNEGTYAHGYFPTPDGNIAVTNNESLALGGFFVGGTTVCPGEGLGFYDTSLASEGVVLGPLSYYVPPVQGRGPDSRACTSHFGKVASNNVVMSVGWYILGGRVVDFADPTFPIEIGAATMAPTGGSRDVGTEAWSAKFYKGPYMYVGDQGRGFDVFKWTGPEACGNPFDDTYDSDCMVESGQYRLVVDPSTPAPLPTRVTANVGPSALRTQGDSPSDWKFNCQI